MTQLTHIAACERLARERPMTSLIDRDILAESADMIHDKADYIPLYYDLGHAVTSDCGTMTAYRAITMRGELHWLVFTEGKTRGYHGMCEDPFLAIERARAVRVARRKVKSEWAAVEKTARDLIWGRTRFWVTVEDLEASPLCTAGIDAYRTRFGLTRFRRAPGRFVALLMLFEPQIGFILHAAMVRLGVLIEEVEGSDESLVNA